VLRELAEDDSPLCNNLWEWKDAKSENFIRSLILLSGGYGLFDETTNELLSFALVNDHLGTGVLNTVQHARGKGYGKFVAKFLSRKIVDNFDLFPTSYINSQNSPSMDLYTKIGYKKIGRCNWILIENS
jgi:FR47-like protein